MTSRNRLVLMLCLALAGAAFARHVRPLRKRPVAQSGKIIQLTRAGKYAEALPLAQAMVAQLEKGPARHRDLAGALNNLAQVYGDMGRDAEAEPLYKRALAIMEKAVGLNSADIAPELNNLAALYQRQLRYAEAEPLFKRALAIREKALPPIIPTSDNPSTISPRSMRSRTAMPSPSRCPSARSRSTRRLPGAEHPAVATLLNNLGQVTKAEGRYADAEPRSSSRSRSARRCWAAIMSMSRAR